MARTKLKIGHWRMVRPCADCPFNSHGEGLHLRRSLHAGRFEGILTALRNYGHFICHKTTRATGDGSNRLCAGAIRWQRRRKLPSQAVQVMERMDLWATRRAEQSTASVRNSQTDAPCSSDAAQATTAIYIEFVNQGTATQLRLSPEALDALGNMRAAVDSGDRPTVERVSNGGLRWVLIDPNARPHGDV